MNTSTLSPFPISPSAALEPKLNLGPITRILIQREDDQRAGMTLSISDVRAMVDEITRLSRAVLQAREYAHDAILALLDHDLPKIRGFLNQIAGLV